MPSTSLRTLAYALVLLAAALLGREAVAGGLDESLSRLAGANFADKIAAVEAIGVGGEERAAVILQALLDGRLVVERGSGRIVIAEPTGSVLSLRDPKTGDALGDVGKADVDVITVNNRLRGVLRGALGSLTLLSPDAGQRLAAADAVFRGRDAGSAAVLEKALARETDEGVRARMQRALAAVRALGGETTALRIAAIGTLAGYPDPDVGSLLSEIAAGDGDPTVKAIAADAQEQVAARLKIWSVVTNLFQGISLGSVLLLAAVGLAITFGVMGVINMAHGEIMMLGAYTTFAVQEVFRQHAPQAFDYSLAVAIPAAFLVAALAGILIERGIIRFLYGRPLETLLATWGLSLVLQQAVRSIFGATNKEVGSPAWMSGAIEITGGLQLTYTRIWIIVFSMIVFALLMVLIARSSFGLQMRAVTQNRRMAASMGIRTGYVDALTFGLGSGIAGIAGVALSQIDNVSPNLGQSYIIDSFLVVVFGGVGNLWGTLFGAFALGIVNKLLEPFAGAVLGKILVLVAIILFIQKRPRGLFALKGRAVEA